MLLFGAILSVNDNGRRSDGVGMGNRQVLYEFAVVFSHYTSRSRSFSPNRMY